MRLTPAGERCIRRPAPILATIFATLAVLVAAAMAPAEAGGNVYQLGSQDKISVRVVEWRAAQEQYVVWDAINGDYIVGAGGTVTIPLVGELTAQGRTTAELGERVAERLHDDIGLIGKIGVSVEITQYRPFYVMGSVEAPGEYAYRPGITVMQAVSLAGGRYRSSEVGGIAALPKLYETLGDLEVLETKINRALLRQARLAAEQNESEEIDTPGGLLGGAEVAAAGLEEERAILKARLEAFDSEAENLENVQTSLQEQIRSLRERKATVAEQIDHADEQLRSVQNLVSRGLATTSREADLRRQVADLRGAEIGWETALLEVQQQIDAAAARLLTMQNTRRTEIAEQLTETSDALRQLLKERAAMQSVLAASSALAVVADQRTSQRLVEPTYTVMRVVDGTSRQLEVGPEGVLQPGDVLTVNLPTPRSVEPAQVEGPSAPLQLTATEGCPGCVRR